MKRRRKEFTAENAKSAKTVKDLGLKNADCRLNHPQSSIHNLQSSIHNLQSVKPLVCGRIERVDLVGCGGTGSILAEHLARMIAGFRLATTLRLWDGDVVEEGNVARQNFAPHEVGINKAHALAVRLSGQFGLPVTACTEYATSKNLITLRESAADKVVLLITAVDSIEARAQIADGLPPRRCLWIDCGNEHHTGQAVLGTTHSPQELHTAHAGWNAAAMATTLPDVAALNGELAAAMNGKRRGRKRPLTPGCADAPFATQGFGVNAASALAAASLAKGLLVDGRTAIAQVWFDTAAGRMLPVGVTRSLLEPWKAADGGKAIA